MIVLADSWRMGVCRSCGATIEWVTPIKSTHAVPFNPPISFARQMFEQLDPQTAEVDLVRSVHHNITCPQAVAWRRRYGGQRR
jgi:hypothetical protein